ncbi:hypothetical protein DXG01_001120 [Tephrocybe rancida]|nr:hypothetical protein DXG01_001120 [Tephrocybe rancida]
MSTGIEHISFNTFVHEDNKEDFKKMAPSKQEAKKNLAQAREERRCHRCGVVGADGLKICGKCKFSRYCSRECQTADWPEHKKSCKTPRVKNDNDEDRHPDLAMKLVLHVPVSDYLTHLFQLYATISMSLLANPDAVDTHMLKITVNTLPSDTMEYMRAMMSGQDKTKLQVMLNIAKLEPVPLALTPAMQLELTEMRAKWPAHATVIPLMFTNGDDKQFFYPTLLRASAVDDARKRPTIQMKSTLNGITELPLNEENLRDTLLIPGSHLMHLFLAFALRLLGITINAVLIYREKFPMHKTAKKMSRNRRRHAFCLDDVAGEYAVTHSGKLMQIVPTCKVNQNGDFKERASLGLAYDSMLLDAPIRNAITGAARLQFTKAGREEQKSRWEPETAAFS